MRVAARMYLYRWMDAAAEFARAWTLRAIEFQANEARKLSVKLLRIDESKEKLAKKNKKKKQLLWN